MSYHDCPPDWKKTGIGIVNPLHEQRDKITQLEKFLKEIAEEIQDPALKKKIENILK